MSRYIIWSGRYFTHQTRVSVQRSVTPPKFSGPQSKRGRTGRHRLRVHSASSRMYLLHRRFSKKRKCLPHLEVASGGSSLVRIVQREFVFLLLFLLILCLFFYFLTVLLKWIFSFFKNFYWRVVDLQYHVTFRCTAQCFSYVPNIYIYIYSFSDSFPL